MALRSFQARLQAKQGRISQKLVDIQISRMGVITDAIRIRANRDQMGDSISKIYDNIDIINIIFPKLEDIPMYRFQVQQGQLIFFTSANDAISKEEDKKQPFDCGVMLQDKVSQDDLIFKFYDNPTGDEPFCLVLQCKDILGTFGGRSIIWQKARFTYFDEPIDASALAWVMQMYNRREVLGW